MKTSTKIGIGFSIATIAGVYAAVTFSEKIIEKFEHEATRYKTKKIVNEKFGGNDKLLDVVEDLSDSELEVIGQVVTEIKDGRKKINNLGEKIKSSTESFLENL
ncbi:hypothetical protein [Vagococcus fluvialis]|uniref:hypothetical protein n=1 Tax=Vagococcus fluvialis TaxID=2738 RepID=UPI00379D124C